jgi:hypothetical protein
MPALFWGNMSQNMIMHWDVQISNTQLSHKAQDHVRTLLKCKIDCWEVMSNLTSFNNGSNYICSTVMHHI